MRLQALGARYQVLCVTHLAQVAARADAHFEITKSVKAGRTHLMDATPVMLGQELGGYAAIVRLGIERIRSALPRVGCAYAFRTWPRGWGCSECETYRSD